MNVKVKTKESEKENKYFDLARDLKKAIEHDGVGDTKCKCCALNNPKGLVKGMEDLEIRQVETISIIKYGQNTEPSPGELRRLAVIQTPAKDLQLALV